MRKLVIDNLNLSDLDTTFITWELENFKKLDLELIYGSNFLNTGTIRNFVSLLCDKLYIDPILKFKMILITDELNNNAIEYGSLEKDVNKMRISIIKDDLYYHFIIETEDSWKWKYHKTSKEMQILGEKKLKEWFKNHFSIRWRWLFLIIKNIVDEIYFKDSITWWLIVGIKKKIKI